MILAEFSIRDYNGSLISFRKKEIRRLLSIHNKNYIVLKNKNVAIRRIRICDGTYHFMKGEIKSGRYN